uniref:Retrotransposon gag domain-containing protein n=1 Tax=Ananas comosus var. bracteatus TaxID=296719 RepID=A0A6V7P257_ANACO|nr:unnamed protein product [Ananas comosus var. bracteatus]
MAGLGTRRAGFRWVPGRDRDRSMAEYEQEFSHIIDCVPDVIKDDRDRAEWFLRGLRPGIYKAVQILKLATFAEVFDRALWAEHGDPHVREKRELLTESKDKGKKRQGGGSSGDIHVTRSPEVCVHSTEERWSAAMHDMRQRPPGLAL